jgi:hypothetical protein
MIPLLTVAILGGAPDAGTSLADADAVPLCVELHEHLAKCPAEFIDLMIDLRAKHEPGFAAKVKDPKARADVRKAGIDEAKADGTDNAAKCEHWVKTGPKTTASDASIMRGCFANDACPKLMTCISPVLERRMGARAAENKWDGAKSK